MYLLFASNNKKFSIEAAHMVIFPARGVNDDRNTLFIIEILLARKQITVLLVFIIAFPGLSL